MRSHQRPSSATLSQQTHSRKSSTTTSTTLSHSRQGSGPTTSPFKHRGSRMPGANEDWQRYIPPLGPVGANGLSPANGARPAPVRSSTFPVMVGDGSAQTRNPKGALSNQAVPRRGAIETPNGTPISMAHPNPLQRLDSLSRHDSINRRSAPKPVSQFAYLPEQRQKVPVLPEPPNLQSAMPSSHSLSPPPPPYEFPPQLQQNRNRSASMSARAISANSMMMRPPSSLGSTPGNLSSTQSLTVSTGTPGGSNTSGSLASPHKHSPKLCYACNKPIIGSVVRAMDHTYHVECFTCYDCGKQCADKFFAEEVEVPTSRVQDAALIDPESQDSPMTKKITVPLCEYDYFRRIDLICYTCNKAIRGSYITAVGRKYHPEHFYCETCKKVFETQDYYEHDSKIYCHYHYSRKYAAHCESCKSAILKQYVEMHRGGREQQWHPECFMIHKFWGVDITLQCIGVGLELDKIDPADETVLTPTVLFNAETRLERMTMSIWVTLEPFEASCATCISDMLHTATIDDKLQGLLATGRLVMKIECLFKGIDSLEQYADKCHIAIDYEAPENRRLLPLVKEPRALSSKLMSYLTFLRENSQTKLAQSPKSSRELLSMISALAHYTKLISGSSLRHALTYNKLTQSTRATDKYLQEVSVHDSIQDDVFPSLKVPYNAKDQCFACGQSIEDRCFMFEGLRWHPQCLKCRGCGKKLDDVSNVSELSFNRKMQTVLCESCGSGDVDATAGFKAVSRYSQLIYLLKIALVRSKYTMEKQGLIEKVGVVRRNVSLRDRYSRQVDDITSMRSARQSRKLGTTGSEYRKSMILEVPEPLTADTEEVDGEPESGQSSRRVSFIRKKNKSLGKKGTKTLRIEDVPMQAHHGSVSLDATSNLLKNEKGLTLDDIPRIVSSEQSREIRPNAYKFQNRNYQSATSGLPTPKAVKRVSDIPEDNKENQQTSKDGKSLPPEAVTHARNSTILPAISENATQPVPPKRYSELSPLEHDYMRYVAAFALHEVMGDELSLDECLSFVGTRRVTSFWGKIFGGKKTSVGDVNKVFGAPLDALDVKYGTDSDLGVGPAKLRIPTLVDDLINAMHAKDLSAEGVFRLNGNIRRLKKLIADIDANPEVVPDLFSENAIQLAALLKKFARAMPDPLLTFKLYDIFILSHKYKEETDDAVVKRTRILKLAYSMLPKPHRDLTEVLLAFLSWVATFSHIDEETGSKMDVHNLATVMTPNILYAKPPKPTGKMPDSADLIPNGENHFLAIEVVNTMISNHQDLSVIPSDLLDLFEAAGFSSAQALKQPGLSSKEIITRCKLALEKNPKLLAS